MLLLRPVAQLLLVTAVTFILHATAFSQPATNTAPALRIKSIFAGPIWRSDIDPSEAYAVVSNAYDSVSTWAIDLPGPANNLRVPILNEEKKRAHAVGLSPSAEQIAYSTPPVLESTVSYQPESSRIYVLNRANGQVIHLITGPDQDITTRPQALRFSPDGKHLAAVLSSGCGLRVWATDNWQLVAKYDIGYGDTDGQDRCCRSNNIEDCDRQPDSNSLAFYPVGSGKSLLLTSSDSGVHSFILSNDELTPIAFASARDLDLERPGGISISASGKYVVVGDRIDPRSQAPLRYRIALIEPNSLKLQSTLQLPASSLRFSDFFLANRQASGLAQFSLDRVAFLSVNGTDYIFAATLPCSIAATIPLVSEQPAVTAQSVCMLRWTVGQGDQAPIFIPMRTNRVAELLPLNRRGGILVTSQDMISLMAPDGRPLVSGIQRTFNEINTAADFRNAKLDFSVSADGRAVKFADYRSTATFPLSTAFNLRNVPHPISPSPDVNVESANQDSTIIESWENSGTPIINSKPLPDGEISKDELFRSVAVQRERKLVLLGSSEYLRVISFAGESPRVLCRLPITAEAYRVNMTADGALAISAHSDGTVRWHKIEIEGDRCVFAAVLSVRFSQLADDSWTWTAWLPDGTHAQALDAQDGLVWQSPSATNQVVITPFERLQSFYSPDAIMHALDGATVHNEPLRTDRLIASAPPVNTIEVLPNPPSIRANTERITLGLRIADDQHWPKTIVVRVNNTPAQVFWRGANFSTATPLTLTENGLSNGRLEIDLLLPTSVRTVRRDFQICFYINLARDTCHVMAWTGDLAKPSRRRLWGVFVGLSRYADSRINLQFAENDVIDLARLFVNDFEAKSVVLKERYHDMHLDLALAASAPGETELASIASKSYVHRFEPTRAGILAAVQDIITSRSTEDSATTEQSDDLFIFYFSGHGVIAPTKDDQGRILLTTRDTKLHQSEDELEATTIRTSELLDLLEAIPGNKLIIFDACRSLLAGLDGDPFDPNLVISDLRNHAVSANVIFSSDVGQASREERDPAFDHTRPKARQGNGLFSYALLHALTTDVTVLNSAKNSVVEVRVLGLVQYFETAFFNTELSGGEAARIMKKNNWTDMQMPKFYPTTAGDTNQLIRAYANSERAR